eukprot:7894296-Prorocentrum_lima.AAC.1
MTSSLVGSEMCIRDSSIPLGELAGQIALHHLQCGMHFIVENPQSSELFEPVSYTHLTLPTICSV